MATEPQQKLYARILAWTNLNHAKRNAAMDVFMSGDTRWCSERIKMGMSMVGWEGVGYATPPQQKRVLRIMGLDTVTDDQRSAVRRLTVERADLIIKQQRNTRRAKPVQQVRTPVAPPVTTVEPPRVAAPVNAEVVARHEQMQYDEAIRACADLLDHVSVGLVAA